MLQFGSTYDVFNWHVLLSINMKLGGHLEQPVNEYYKQYYIVLMHVPINETE